jgi:hypothetical protein
MFWGKRYGRASPRLLHTRNFQDAGGSPDSQAFIGFGHGDSFGKAFKVLDKPFQRNRTVGFSQVAFRRIIGTGYKNKALLNFMKEKINDERVGNSGD